MNDIKICEGTDTNRNIIIDLSKTWCDEQITYGLRPTTIEVISKCRFWLVYYNNTVIAYIAGKVSSDHLAIIPCGDKFFEIEEFYVIKEFRSKGIGNMLFGYLENVLRSENVHNIVLSTATKDQERVQKFYINKLGMSVWTTTLFKKIV